MNTTPTTPTFTTPRLTAALALALTLVGCGGSSSVDTSLAAPVLATRRWHVSGRSLLDDLGREMVLRGYNTSGRSKMAPFLPFDVVNAADLPAEADAYFAKLEGLGANVVRLVFGWEAVEPVHGTYDEAFIANYRTLLDAADAHRISVLVDFHQDVFASPFCGDGFPVWAIGSIPHGAAHFDCGFPAWSEPAFVSTSPVSQAFDAFWSNEGGLQDDFEAMWRHFAAAIGDHRAVGAYDMFNEPAPGSTPLAAFDSTVIPAFHRRIGTAIRETVGDVPVFGCGRVGDSIGDPTMLEPPSPPLAGFGYSPHYYHGLTTIGYPELLADSVREGLETTLAPSATWNVPVILGEFGVPNTSPIKGPYLDLVYDILDEHVAHATMWEAGVTGLSWNGEDFSIFDAEGNERDWASVVVRAYPRAVAGHIVRFAWDGDTKHFELDVANATEHVTEIELPTRHVGSSPRIAVTGGARYRHDPARNLLLVRAPAGSSYRVTVDPR